MTAIHVNARRKDLDFNLAATCHFGTEAVLKKEISGLGLEITEVTDGRVVFKGNEEAVARANVFIRTAERIMILMGQFEARTFEELFEETKKCPWESVIPKNGRFWVTKATSVNSKLFSSSSIQSIVKKAMVERMKSAYKTEIFSEDGDDYPVRAFLNKDKVMLCLDTTGVSLHKRGYRKLVGKAPISETLAASLIMLTPWHHDRVLVDPFCGSGTFPIEAALIGLNIAPGMNRTFTAMNWDVINTEPVWDRAVDEARSLIRTDRNLSIQGYDIDSEMVRCAIKNARAAGVADQIHFQARAVKDLKSPKSYGFIITNPPYGERLEERADLPGLYREIGESYKGLSDWSMFIITSYEDAERYIGRKADKNRKLYNGMIRAYFYQFMGKKPPKRS